MIDPEKWEAGAVAVEQPTIGIVIMILIECVSRQVVDCPPSVHQTN